MMSLIYIRKLIFIGIWLIGIFLAVSVRSSYSGDSQIIKDAKQASFFSPLLYDDERKGNSLELPTPIYYGFIQGSSLFTTWRGNIKRYEMNNNIYPEGVNGHSLNDIANPPFFLNQNIKSFWSSEVDGNDIEKGGVASKLTQNRLIYSNLNGEANVDITQMSNRVKSTNLNITSSLLEVLDSDRSSLLDWASGIDVDDEDADGSIIDDRTTMAEPLHTRPKMIDYFIPSSGKIDQTLYFTTNDGMLYGINPIDGSTVFSFIPKKLLRLLKYYKLNLNTSLNLSSDFKPYGMDGHMTFWHKDVNNDGDVLQSFDGVVDPSEHVYLYQTMRRGGNDIYALDITNRTKPILKWMIEGDLNNDKKYDSIGDFPELGQTWSEAMPTSIKWKGVDKQVIFFGAGYDADADASSLIVKNDLGRAIYMVDAETGDKLWSAGKQNTNLNLLEMDYSIVASLALIDINQDGNTDFFYAVDIGGQVWRFDINENNMGATDFASGGRIAKISDSTEVGARKFFDKPDISLSKNQDYLYIVLTSGIKAKPLSTLQRHALYAFKDPNIFTPPLDYTYDGNNIITESSLYDVTNNLITSTNTAIQKQAKADLNAKQGWYLPLSLGENTYSSPRIVKSTVIFNTLQLDSTGQGVGVNRMYIVSLYDGREIMPARSRQLNSKQVLSQALPVLSDEKIGVCIATECSTSELAKVPLFRTIGVSWKEN